MPRRAWRHRRPSGANRASCAACARWRSAHLSQRCELARKVGARNGAAASVVSRRGRLARRRRARLARAAAGRHGAGARGATWRSRRRLLRRGVRLRRRRRVLVNVRQAERHAAADRARAQRAPRPRRGSSRLRAQRAPEASMMQRRLKLLAPRHSLLEARQSVGRRLPRDGIAVLHAACLDGRVPLPADRAPALVRRCPKRQACRVSSAVSKAARSAPC